MKRKMKKSAEEKLEKAYHGFIYNNLNGTNSQIISLNFMFHQKNHLHILVNDFQNSSYK